MSSNWFEDIGTEDNLTKNRIANFKEKTTTNSQKNTNLINQVNVFVTKNNKSSNNVEYLDNQEMLKSYYKDCSKNIDDDNKQKKDNSKNNNNNNNKNNDLLCIRIKSRGRRLNRPGGTK